MQVATREVIGDNRRQLDDEALKGCLFRVKGLLCCLDFLGLLGYVLVLDLLYAYYIYIYIYI